jgi:hypothetical protein
MDCEVNAVVEEEGDEDDDSPSGRGSTTGGHGRESLLHGDAHAYVDTAPLVLPSPAHSSSSGGGGGGGGDVALSMSAHSVDHNPSHHITLAPVRSMMAPPPRRSSLPGGHAHPAAAVAATLAAPVAAAAPSVGSGSSTGPSSASAGATAAAPVPTVDGDARDAATEPAAASSNDDDAFAAF